jgi:hypothetical protein
MKALGAVFDYEFGKEDICKICVTEEYNRMWCNCFPMRYRKLNSHGVNRA